MADTFTTNYNLTKPEIGRTGWGDEMNANLDAIDAQMKSTSDAVDSLTTADVPDSADKRYVTDAQKTAIGAIPVKATGAELNTGTDDAKFATAKALADSDYAKTTDIPVKATGAEADTGTDDAKFLTAKAAKDSHNIPSVAPGTSGNVLTSNGTDWTSAAPAGGVSATRGVFSKTDMTYKFTVATPSVEPTAGATYTNNTFTFTVVSYAANVLTCTGTGYPTSSGTLTKASGTGDATLTFTAFTASYVVTHNLALPTSPYTVIVKFANGATNKAIGDIDDIDFATNSMTFYTTSLASIHTGTFGYAYIAG